MVGGMWCATGGVECDVHDSGVVCAFTCELAQNIIHEAPLLW